MKIYPQKLFSFYDNALETDAESLQEENEWGRSTMFSDTDDGLGFAIENDKGSSVKFLLEKVERDDDSTVLFWQLAPVNLPEHSDLKVIVYP